MFLLTCEKSLKKRVFSHFTLFQHLSKDVTHDKKFLRVFLRLPVTVLTQLFNKRDLIIRFLYLGFIPTRAKQHLLEIRESDCSWHER